MSARGLESALARLYTDPGHLNAFLANPAAALGRMWSDSFAGIAPASVPAFVLAQCAGAAIGLALHRAFGTTSVR